MLKNAFKDLQAVGHFITGKDISFGLTVTEKISNQVEALSEKAINKATKGQLDSMTNQFSFTAGLGIIELRALDEDASRSFSTAMTDIAHTCAAKGVEMQYDVRKGLVAEDITTPAIVYVSFKPMESAPG